MSHLVFACQWRLRGFPLCRCGLCCLAPDGYANGDINANSHAYDDLYAEPEFHSDTEPGVDCDGNRDVYSESDEYADTQQDANVNLYADVYTYTYYYGDLYIHSYTDLYAQPNIDV